MNYVAKIYKFSFVLYSSLLTFTAGALSFSSIAHAETFRIAIANYGPHASLEDIIRGFKQEMNKAGYREGDAISYEILHVNFDHALIPQMIAKIKLYKPHIVVTLSTPITQAAKHMIKDAPIVFAGITDPVYAGIIPTRHKASKNISGASDEQDLTGVIQFAKSILPQAQTVGLLYAPSEANDHALLKKLIHAASQQGMKVIPLAIHHPLDIPTQMQTLRGKVDFIYVGTSGPIQPSLPAIAVTANKLNIPLFNADTDAVRKGLALGAFAVSYQRVGAQAARIAKRVLEGEKIKTIPPYYPTLDDHEALLSRQNLKRFGLSYSGSAPIVE